MNAKRGFFRIWLAFSVLFAAVVFIITFDNVRGEFNRARFDQVLSKDEVLLPVPCKDARGKKGVDFTAGEGLFNDLIPDAKCTYRISDFRRLYPEYNDLSDNILTRRIYEKANIAIKPPAEPWTTLGVAMALALGVPLLLLGFGITVAWVAAGFKHQTRKP